MRTTTIKFKKISVTEEVYNRLIKDRNTFQKIIGGGKWSISDTIIEYFKILKTVESKKEKESKKK
jgi:predicted CopG family antitoxin